MLMCGSCAGEANNLPVKPVVHMDKLPPLQPIQHNVESEIDALLSANLAEDTPGGI